MELLFLIIIQLFLGSSLGQSISCLYSESIISGTEHYVCTAQVQNPTGFDDFTTVNGTHLEGRSNDDVTAVLVSLTSDTAAFPQILCIQFPNLVHVDYSFVDVTTVNENSFSRCENLQWLRLWYNRIESVHEKSFANNKNLRHLNLGANNLQKLSEDIFVNLSQLEVLILSNNNFRTLADGIFRNIVNIKELMLDQTNLNEYKVEWFENLSKLEVLNLYGNNITELPMAPFNNITNLLVLDLSSNPLSFLHPHCLTRLILLRELYISSTKITEINPIWFENHELLEILHIHSNRFASIPENSFDALTSLRVLDISNNRLTDELIPQLLFNSLLHLEKFYADYNFIQTLNHQWFQNLVKLKILSLNFNRIFEIPTGIFSSFERLQQLGLWYNHIKTIRRDAFGDVRNLSFVNIDSNLLNSIDEKFLNDAENLDILHVMGNRCADDHFFDFAVNRENFMAVLRRCIRNFELTIETRTEASMNYQFFGASYPGIQVHVTGVDRGVHVALMSDQNPLELIEVRLRCAAVPVSRIFRNGELIVEVPTPYILREDQWNDFSVTWANNVILAFEGDKQLPFMAYTMNISFPVSFIGVRTPVGRALWNIEPFELRTSD